MYYWFLAAVLFSCLVHTSADAGGPPAVTFVDGRWRGDIEPGPGGTGLAECRARTTFDDGTTLALAERTDGKWYLQLSNPGWRLPNSHRYAMDVLVDFYPRVQSAAEARSRTLLEIADLEQISLLGFIENGHTIRLTSDGFSEVFDLEGSAKVIQWIRNCFAGL